MVDDLPIPAHLEHPFQAEGATDDVAHQTLKGVGLASFDVNAGAHAETGMFPGKEVFDDVCRDQLFGQEQIPAANNF